MSTPSDITAKIIHDLWSDARQFTIDISRPTSTTIALKITRPTVLQVTDGAIVLLSEKPISALNHPDNGESYTASTDYIAPADVIGNAKIVGAFYGILNNPLPIDETVVGSGATGLPLALSTFTITITNTNPNTIYYASVHAASNVLQYYPIGVQSYPLEGTSSGPKVTTYTGNIPSFPSAPTSPGNGTVYHDQQLNLIQYFDATSGAWIPSRSDTIISGQYNPGVLGQVYLYAGGILKVFNGRKWVTTDALNFQVKIGSAYLPFVGISSNIKLPDTPTVGELVYNYSTERVQFWDGLAWQFPSATNTLFNNGTLTVPVYVPGFVLPMTVEPIELADPYIGQLFYNTTSQVLNAWNGTAWVKVNTDQEGAPSTDKVAIGTDGSYEERTALIKVLQSQLGYPQMCVELTEDQFNIAIDNALQNYRLWSDGAYRLAYIPFKILGDQQKYYLNNPIDKTDHIVDIVKIHRLNILGMGSSDNYFFQNMITDMYYGNGSGDLLSAHLMASLSEEFERIFAGNLTFLWDEPTRELFITRRVASNERVIIEAMMERPEQELLVDRWSQQFIQGWANAELKMVLGLIRSKFSSGTPGPDGAITLNGELLIAEARQDMAELKQSALDYEWGGHVGKGNLSFLIG